MAATIQRQLRLESSNIEKYCSADGLSLNAGGYAIRKWLNGGSTGYATLNAAAMAELYPTETATPDSLDSEIRGSRSAGSMSAALQVGGTSVHRESYSSISLSTRTKTGITDAAVTASTRQTLIRWEVDGANGNNQRLAHVYITLHFTQYSATAAIGNGADGVQSASVSNSAPYRGDTVTFAATIKSGAIWHGWYSDAACTQLVSTSQTYTTAAADLTLYAKATREITGTGAYVKVGGQWAEAQKVYKKINGSWVLQTDDSYKTEMQNGKYKFKEE